MLIPKGTKPRRIKPRRLQDRSHLEYVASLPCCIPTCRKTPVQVHHILRGVIRGTGLRAGDDKVLPLCFECHRKLHDYGDETWFLEQHGIDGLDLAAQLWELSHE